MSNRRRLRVPGRYEHQPTLPPSDVEFIAQWRAMSEAVATAQRAPERTSVTEASVGGATATKPGRMLVRLIKAGVSLNGNAYSAQVLREAAANKAWPRGCQAFCDHASEEEEAAHPSGSVKNLAGVLTEDARWDEASQSLVAEVRLFAPWRETLTDMAEHIGMSIRAWVTGEHGEYEGREAFVVQRIESGRSVDFVTVPAAGGAIISVLEAVGNTVPVAEARNAGHWFEANIHSSFTRTADDMFGEGYLTREERITLSSAVGDGLSAFAARIEQDAPHLYSRDPWSQPPEATTTTADEVASTAPPAEPITTVAAEAVASDVPDGAPPPPPAPPTHHPEEEPVSGTQTGAPPEQAGIAPVPDSGQPPTTPTVPPAPAPEPTPAPAPQPTAPQPSQEAVAQSFQQMLTEAMRPIAEQLAQVTAREAARDAENRNLRNRQTAAEAVTEALRAAAHTDVAASITGRVTTRVTAQVPTTAEGFVDTAKLGELITAVVADEATHVRRERANALAEAGVGLPYGMGGAPAQEATDDGLDGELEAFFKGSLGLSESAARIAGKGR